MRQASNIMQGGNEWGFVVCNAGGLRRGRESTGHPYGVRLDLHCQQGKPLAIFHTHPGTGNITPSSADIREARRHKIPYLCVGIPETGQIKCYQV